MATTLEQLQSQLDKLRAARGSGVLRVTDGPKTVEYRTMEDLELAITRTIEDIARMQAANGVTVPSRTMRSMTAKGT
jgi:hypothetical protein